MGIGVGIGVGLVKGVGIGIVVCNRNRAVDLVVWDQTPSTTHADLEHPQSRSRQEEHLRTVRLVTVVKALGLGFSVACG